MDIIEMRGDAIVCFKKNVLTWVHMDVEKTLKNWVKQCGFNTISEFNSEKSLTRKDLLGHTISITGSGNVLFADKQPWWDSLDLRRIKAVMNERIFGWALNGAFLSFMGELEFAENVMMEFKKVSGDPVQDALSSIFMQKMWYPALNTTEFLEGVSEFLIKEYSLGIEDPGIQYF